MDRTKVVAFADDLIMATRVGSVKAVKNYVNVELNKLNEWTKNKTRFNDKKSKVMLVSRRKRKENKKFNNILKQQKTNAGNTD